ncbi:MAG: GNAT family N-acetyltransferase [Actinomycetota bacterium]|nr:GNAT family N-acetyltransferase [Actinomycetota bacterium]
MPELVPPTTAVQASFLAAMNELLLEGVGTSPDDSMVAREIKEFGSAWRTSEGFSKYVERLLADARESTLRPSYLVANTTYWWIEEDRYLGRISIRHRLTPRLLEIGGHIGYDVRPSARRQGHATAMLAAVLPHANELGIDPALVTCDTDNVGSRKVIEANGGIFEDERSGKLRYWIPTGRAAR